MDFRGLASDCVCNHRTPPTSSCASTVSYRRLSSILSLLALLSLCSTHLKGSLSCTLSSSRISNTSPPRTYFTPVKMSNREVAKILLAVSSYAGCAEQCHGQYNQRHRLRLLRGDHQTHGCGKTGIIVGISSPMTRW